MSDVSHTWLSLAKIYFYFCADNGCCWENLLSSIDDRYGWCERLKGIYAINTTWWYIYACVSVCVCVCAQIYRDTGIWFSCKGWCFQKTKRKINCTPRKRCLKFLLLLFPQLLSDIAIGICHGSQVFFSLKLSLLINVIKKSSSP